MKIIIVGGGSAGWMTAATLIRTFPNYDISLIESPDVPTVGVGESTLGRIRNWTEYLQIDEKSFMRATDASFKLSIKFTDFYKKGEAFHYPFGNPNLDNCREGINDWWVLKSLHDNLDLSFADSYYVNMAFINKNTFSNNYIDELKWDPKFNIAYHFDATKFAKYLKDNYCIPKGVKHISEDIKTIEQNENGIKTLNNKYSADLFIDCTGFKALLIDKTLNEPFESYNDILPNDSAWATRLPYTDKDKELKPYTNCTAIENGWVWNIPLWSRIGTGYVYSSKFVDDDTALNQLQNHLKRDDLTFKNIKMRVGIHKRLWVKNVAAVGLSAGFIEPLESNGLFSVHEFLIKLLRQLQRKHVSQWDKDNYTFSCKRIFRRFAEFVSMHYALSHRTDTEYWKYLNNKTFENNLITLNSPKVHGFQLAADDRDSRNTIESNSGLSCIGAGMHWGPIDLPTLLYENVNSNIEDWIYDWNSALVNLKNKKNKFEKIAATYPTLKEYLEKIIF